MSDKKSVFAICGSTRAASANLHLINAIALLTADKLEFDVYNGIAALPHYNPDLDHNNPPEAVLYFRQKLRAADGVLICTPEYAMGLPGSLKNALDWTVSSMEFSGKPVLAITAATSGEKAHQSLLGTLNIIEAKTADTSLLIPFIKTKLNNQHQITDEPTLQQVKEALRHFVAVLNQEAIP